MLLGVCGKARHGKDCLTDILKSKYNYSQYFFAKPVKDACKVIFDLSDEQLYGDLKETVDERWGISPREMLQTFGTEIMQYEFGNKLPAFKDKIYRSFWVEKFKNWYKQNSSQNIVISDVRFQHELDALRELNATIIKVDASKRIKSTDNHLSENELNDVEPDFIVYNNGTLSDFEHVVIELMDQIS
jgi:hypothetical protein